MDLTFLEKKKYVEDNQLNKLKNILSVESTLKDRTGELVVCSTLKY